MPAMKMMTMSSLMLWKTQQSSLLSLLTQSITGKLTVFHMFFCYFLSLYTVLSYFLLFFPLNYRRSGSNVSGFSCETGMDDQSVNVC